MNLALASRGNLVRRGWARWGMVAFACTGLTAGAQVVVADLQSEYHHIQVIDEGDYRILSFNGSFESRILRSDPLQGHFDYVNALHVGWLWQTGMTKILVVGLGGGTFQQALARDFPQLTIDTVELDPMVVTVARQYFGFRTSERQRVHVAEGRKFLEQAKETYDWVALDAYSRDQDRSYVPRQLATREFFTLVRSRLSTNGVVCYNVMGTLQGADAGVVHALYRTMKAVFPQVYFFPVAESHNVVLVASMEARPMTFEMLHQRAAVLLRSQRVKVPGFQQIVYSFRADPPYGIERAPIWTDESAPREGEVKEQPVRGPDR